MIIKDLQQRSEQWFALRKGRLTGSVFAAAAGLNRHQSRQKLYRTMLGIDPPFEGNVFTRWGTEWEPFAAAHYEEWLGRYSDPMGFAIDEEDPWIGFSPDGVVDGELLIEIKCPGKKALYSEIPSYYMPQLQGGMQVLGLTRAHLICYVPSRRDSQDLDCASVPQMAVWEVQASERYQTKLRDMLREFMCYLVNREEPKRFGRGQKPTMPEVPVREIYRKEVR